MKAIRVERHGGPEVLEFCELPDPVPGTGELLVRIKAAGVNPVDTYLRAGTEGYATSLPYTPGADAAGVVEAIGNNVARVRVGDRVYTAGTLSGAYAEIALCDASQVQPLPERVSFAQGAAIGVPYPTAYRALFQRARILPGETLLVHGASGGVGTAAVQLARAAGVKIVATAGTAEGLRHVAAQGAHHVVNHRTAEYLTEVRAWTGGRGVDVIVEMLADVNLVKDFEVLARYGRIVVVGSRGAIEFAPRLTMRLDASVLGMSLFNAPPDDVAAAHAAIFAGLEAATLRPVIGREFPLADAASAHRAILDAGALGKIVLLP